MSKSPINTFLQLPDPHSRSALCVCSRQSVASYLGRFHSWSPMKALYLQHRELCRDLGRDLGARDLDHLGDGSRFWVDACQIYFQSFQRPDLF